MKVSAKIMLSLACCVAAPLNVIAAQMSNVIIFGDSLSDGGNLPEVSSGFIDPSAPKVVANTDTEFYVPISDPINTASSLATPPGMGLSKSYNWPSLDDRYLSPQAGIAGSSIPRTFHSISWPQFFISYAYQDGLLASDTITPSYMLETNQYQKSISVNYAWGYALSTTGCSDENYQTLKTCDLKSINDARKSFVTNPSKDTRGKIQIPGVPMQVDLFLQDRSAGKVSVDKNTTYAFWVGGNDLIVANNEMQKGDLSGLLSFMFAAPADNTIKAISHLVDSLPAAQRPEHVYVFGMTNPGLTPDYANSKLAGLGNFVVKSYNYWLTVKAGLYNLLSPTKIEVLPVYDWYQTASISDYFKAHLSQACQVKAGDFSQPSKIPAGNCSGYMYWNGIHPAAPLHMQTAYLFEQDILTEKNMLPSVSAADTVAENLRVTAIGKLIKQQ